MIRLGSAACAAILVALLLGALERTHAQGHSESRLQLHAELTLHGESGTFNYSHIDAVCDTGNGTLLYIVKQSGPEGKTIAVPNGCHKVQAER